MSETSVGAAEGKQIPGGVGPAGGRRMAGAAALVMFFFVLSRATGLLREVIIGALYGTSGELDAYLAAFRVPDILFQLVAGGALGSAFIPTFSEIWTHRGQAAAWLLFSRVLNLVTLVLVVLAGLAALFAQPLVEWVIAPGFAPEQQRLTAALMRWLLVSTVVFGASGLTMGALNAVQHFALPALAPVLYNAAIILGAWFLAPRYGIFGLAAGVVAGAASHFLVQIPGLLRQGVRYRLSFAPGNSAVREVGRLMAPRVLGLFFVQLNFLVNTILASGLAEGRLSALNFAWLLMLLPQGIFAQAIATVAFPTFAGQVAQGQNQAMGRTLAQILGMVLFLTVPAAVVLWTLGVPLVQVLLQRGSFTRESTQLVAYALQFYAIGLVAHGVVEIVVRAFYALHDTLTPVAVGVGAMVLNIGLSILWLGPLAHGGLALANSVATGVEMLVLLWLIRRRLGRSVWGSLGAGAARILAAAAGMALLTWFWTTWSAGQDWLVQVAPPGWIVASVGLGIGLASYLGLSYLLGSRELTTTVGLLGRRTLMQRK